MSEKSKFENPAINDENRKQIFTRFPGQCQSTEIRGNIFSGVLKYRAITQKECTSKVANMVIDIICRILH